MSTWTNDLRHAMRALRKTPGFLIITVGTLALAIGSVVAMCSVALGVQPQLGRLPTAVELFRLAEALHELQYGGAVIRVGARPCAPSTALTPGQVESRPNENAEHHVHS